jgi:hypothetical protein
LSAIFHTCEDISELDTLIYAVVIVNMFSEMSSKRERAGGLAVSATQIVRRVEHARVSRTKSIPYKPSLGNREDSKAVEYSV